MTNNDNYNSIVNISGMTEYYYKSIIIFDKHEIFYIKEWIYVIKWLFAEFEHTKLIFYGWSQKYQQTSQNIQRDIQRKSQANRNIAILRLWVTITEKWYTH